MDAKFLIEKIKNPIYTYWQYKYYRSIERQDFRSALKALKKIYIRFNRALPPYWALELAKVRLSLGQFDKSLETLNSVVSSIKNSLNYNDDTKMFLLKHIEKTHSAALKGKYSLDDSLKIEGVNYIDIKDIDFSKVDPIFREGWPLHE